MGLKAHAPSGTRRPGGRASRLGFVVSQVPKREGPGAPGVVYIAKFADAVYVLHCFQKKSQKTSSEDVALATRRYKELIRELKP